MRKWRSLSSPRCGVSMCFGVNGPSHIAGAIQKADAPLWKIPGKDNIFSGTLWMDKFYQYGNSLILDQSWLQRRQTKNPHNLRDLRRPLIRRSRFVVFTYGHVLRPLDKKTHCPYIIPPWSCLVLSLASPQTFLHSSRKTIVIRLLKASPMSRGIAMEKNLQALELTRQQKSGTRRKM